MKPYAVFFATNRRFFFALAVCLLSMREKSPRLCQQADFFIYYQGLNAEERALLAKIVPCQFREYHFPLQTDFTNINFINFTQLAFARYEIFDLLDSYEKILYMDVDMLVNGELLPVIEKYANTSGLAMCKDIQKGLCSVAKNFVRPQDGYDMTVQNYNSGTMVFGKSLPRRKELKNWCYQKTVQWLENLVCPDQGVLNVLAQEFAIPIEEMPDTCNCLPSNAKYLDKKDRGVLIYHCAGGGLRFWTYTWFSPWQEFYQQYLQQGGPAHTDAEHAWLTFIKKYKLYRFPFFDRSPDPQMHPARFIKYVIKQLF